MKGHGAKFGGRKGEATYAARTPAAWWRGARIDPDVGDAFAGNPLVSQAAGRGR
jgi:hypothetical protein